MKILHVVTQVVNSLGQVVYGLGREVSFRRQVLFNGSFEVFDLILDASFFARFCHGHEPRAAVGSVADRVGGAEFLA